MQLLDHLSAPLASVGVRTKILVMVGGLVLAMGVAVTVQVGVRLSQVLLAELDARAEAIGRDLASRGRDLILTDNRYALKEVLTDVRVHNADVLYAFFLDREGRVVAHSFQQGVPSGLATISSGPPASEPLLRVLDTDGGRVTDVEVAVLAGRAGVARVGLSHRRLRTAIRQTAYWLLATTGLALCGALLIAAVLTRILTHPVLHLVEVTREVGRGNLTVRAVEHSKDEIGELASAFNATLEQLARSQDDLLRRMRELGTLTATTTMVTGKVGIEQALQSALERVVAAMDSPGGAIDLAGDGKALQPVASVGSPGCGTTEEAAAGPSPSEAMPCQVEIALAVRERHVGRMSIICRPGCHFSQEDIGLLEAVGRQLGLAVENAKLWAETETRLARRGEWLSEVIRAQEAERSRISRELHDEAGQLLTTLSIRLRSLEESSQLSADSVVAVAELKEMTKRLMEELHRVAVELRPAALDQLGLVGALDGYVREFSARTGIAAEIDTSGARGLELPPDVEIAVYRVVQEALTNVSKHAHASTVDVLVGRRNGSLIAVVEDDGRGFQADVVDTPLGTRLGLFGMRERAELLGGHFGIESSPAGGTTVFVEVPLRGPS
jgi:signal transduction histidine kinase